MSLSINKKNKKTSSSSLLTNNANAKATITAASTTATATANPLPRKRRAFFNQHQHHQQQQQQQQYKRKPKITKTTSLTALTPTLLATSNINVGNTLFSTLLEQPNIELTQSPTIITTATATGSSSAVNTEVKSLDAAKVEHKIFRTTVMPSFKIMSYQNIIALLTVLVCGLVTVNGLKCYMCGQYNEGVGSITPCLNYSEQYAHLYLKECSKKSEKYCVKYVSELSIVRDCATECAEKEIWETQTYCCTEDGCNGSNTIEASAAVIILPVVFYIVNEMMNLLKQQRR